MYYYVPYTYSTYVHIYVCIVSVEVFVMCVDSISKILLLPTCLLNTFQVTCHEGHLINFLPVPLVCVYTPAQILYSM